MRHRFEYLIVKMVELAVRPLPLQAVRRLGEALGLLFYTVDRVHRRIALANLAVAFPVRTARERQAIAKSMFEHFGRLLLELLKYASLRNDQKLALVEWEGEDRVRLAYASCSARVILDTGSSRPWRTP
jgi:Kdo2-lipid IVA lauroyltransferase/acyltransferase